MQKFQKSVDKSKLGQGKEGPRREVKTPIQVQVQSSEESQVRKQTVLKQKESMYVPQTRQDIDKCIEREPESNTALKYINRPWVTEIKVPIYLDPLIKPPPRLPDLKAKNDRQINLDLAMEINKDFEENLPYQEGIISEIYQRPDKSQLIEPPELADLINTNNIVQK